MTRVDGRQRPTAGTARHRARGLRRERAGQVAVAAGDSSAYLRIANVSASLRRPGDRHMSLGVQRRRRFYARAHDLRCCRGAASCCPGLAGTGRRWDSRGPIPTDGDGVIGGLSCLAAEPGLRTQFEAPGQRRCLRSRAATGEDERVTRSSRRGSEYAIWLMHLSRRGRRFAAWRGAGRR
jgi:hypothetical protein